MIRAVNENVESKDFGGLSMIHVSRDEVCLFRERWITKREGEQRICLQIFFQKSYFLGRKVEQSLCPTVILTIHSCRCFARLLIFFFLRLFKSSIERNTSALLSCKQHRRRKTLLLHSKYVITLPFDLILALNIRVILIWFYFIRVYFWCIFKYVQDGENIFTKRWRTDTAVDYLSKLCQPRDRQFWHFQYLFKLIVSLLLQFWRISLFFFICQLINLTLFIK